MSHKIEAILERVRKYQLPNWQYQPMQVFNPYVLASMGYVPATRDTLQCTICLKEFQIPQQSPPDSSYLQQLSQHDENCIYDKEEGNRIGKEELYLVMEEISTELNERSTCNRYPVLKASAVWKYTQRNHYMLKKVMKLYQIEPEQLNISFFLRLFGWYFSKSEQNIDCLSCYFCGRTLPLTHFETTPHPLQPQDLEGQTEQQRLFNPIEEHRYFCMWTGKQQNWLVLLQDLEDKYSEYMSFRLKVDPLSTKKMKIHIDKYLQAFSEKIEGSVMKLKQVGEEFAKVCEFLSQEKECELAADEMENDRKRIRTIEDEMDEASETVKGNLRSSKKIKTN